MFSKTIKKTKEKTYTPSFSITKRLIVLSTLSFLLILFSSTSFLYWTLKDDLENKDAKFLMEEIFELKSTLQENSFNLESVEKNIKGGGAYFNRFTKYYRRVLDQEGRILIETNGMSDM